MVCGSCVWKLALRLMRNHKIDYVEALLRAEKGIEHFEQRTRQDKPKILSGKGNPSDYSQNCSVTGSCICTDNGCLAASYPSCPEDTNCISSNNCGCACPSPLPNSHYLSDDCSSSNNCGCDCTAIPPLLLCLCKVKFGTSCSCSGSCLYDCDEGYVWNGEACVLIAVPKAGLHPSKIIPLIITD